MSARTFLLTSIGLLTVVSVPVSAQLRCDCTAVVDSCNAKVSVQSSSVEITSDHAECSRVDYFIDGQPFVAVVVDGSQRRDWIARAQPPEVLVQSCQVCRDAGGSAASVSARPAAAAQAAPAPGGNAELTPLIEVAPRYPENAQSRGIEGFVDVKFTVTPRGTVENAEVAAAQPARVFDQAALAAVARWRFAEDPDRAPQTITRRINFDLSDYVFQLSRPSTATASAAANQAAGPRNQCVREQTVYNYGEMVEVGLMNACREPLLVYSCAQGAGRYPGLWVCIDSEESQTLLVAPGDRRSGTTVSVTTAAGPRAFTYADDFFVARTPNTQYWWLACGADDSACRGSARQWVRSVDKQLASIDPEARASIPVARSH